MRYPIEPRDALALASLETRVGLVDHVNLAATAHDLTVFMPGLGGLQGRKDFHISLGLSNFEIKIGCAKYPKTGLKARNEYFFIAFPRMPSVCGDFAILRTGSAIPASPPDQHDLP
ncbi:hypothetical protein [Halothiobacillus diazotrophicus]